jgi:deoxyribodipyrimidine photo-lyase
MPDPRIALFWFRRDLRLTDNAALHRAVTEAAYVVPVYIVSDWRRRHSWTGPARQEFLCGSLASLEKNIEAAGGRLVFRRGRDAAAVLREMLVETGAGALYFNRDPGEPHGLATDRAVRALCRELGVACHDEKDAVLHEAGEVLTGEGGPYRVYTPYSRNWNAQPKPPCRPRVKTFAPLPTALASLRSEPCPTLATWGLSPSGVTMVEPGERAARDRMTKALASILPAYGERRNIPHGQTTSRLSQDLRFGLISIRELHARSLQAMAAAESAAEKKSAQTYINELAWREFYFALLSQYPEVFEHEFNPEWRGLPWSYDDAALARWQDGQTGFPIVDAGMRELRATGFMHNRVRMITAMFLTKDLQLDWRLGERFFMQHLVDGESASNNGGWQWSAGTVGVRGPRHRFSALGSRPDASTQRFHTTRPAPSRRRPPKSGLVRPHSRNFSLAHWADLRTLLVPETRQRALVAELVDAYDSGSYGVTCGGSSPLESTIFYSDGPRPGPIPARGGGRAAPQIRPPKDNKG